ncbi:MAG: DALR anticodon-binding domain-containing protein [Elainellaceae cyanobacterium]
MIDPALFSIRCWLQQTLYDAVVLTYSSLESGAASESLMPKSPRRLHIDPFSVPMNRLKDSQNLCYVSAIAFKLSNLVKNSPLELAQRLTALLSDADAPIRISALTTSSNIWQHTHVSWTHPGWIHLQIGDRGLAEWLTLLTNPLIALGDRPRIFRKTQDRLPGFAGYDSELFQKSNILFEIQYIHARCCSLLKLGDREGLICLGAVHHAASPPSLNHINIHIADPTPIPWLNADKTLRFDHPAERALMIRLIATWDSLHDCSPSHPPSQLDRSVKLAHQLSQAFQAFYQACRMFGDETTNDLSRVQARLGITLATQRVLRLILENRLGVSAPATI